MSLHVIWDNSNVWGSVQTLRSKLEPQVPWFALRAYFRNINLFVTDQRDVQTRIMAGSVPPECEDLWTYAESLGFETNLLKRVFSEEEAREHEQGVDEILHLKIANLILDYDPPQTLAIMSGDSSVSDFGTSFPDQALRALKRGWKVEVYSAKDCIGEAKWAVHVRDYPALFSVRYFDPVYRSISFVKGGEYYRKDAAGSRIYFQLPDRVVSPL